MYTHAHINTFTHMYTNTYIHTHTHTYKHIYTDTHTYTYTHTRKARKVIQKRFTLPTPPKHVMNLPYYRAVETP